MQLHTEYLRTFIALVETQSFTKAGRQVNRSQSAVSMQIKRLEEEVGRQLFERVGKTARPTADGKLLLSHAREIVKAHDEAVASLANSALRGVIRFGSPEHFTKGALPKLLARFATSRPEILVEMHCENSDLIKAAIDEGELDLGLCCENDGSGRLICNEQLAWAASPDFALEKQAVLPLAVEDGCIFTDWALQALDREGIPYRIVYVSRGLSGVFEATRAGLAITPAITRTIPEDMMALGTEQGMPALPQSVIVLHVRKGPLPAHVKCFVEHVITTFRDEI